MPRCSESTVNMERRPQRQVQRADADRLQGIRKRLVILGAEALAPDDDRDARNQSDGYLPGRTDPVVIERKLEEVGNPNQQRKDANPVAANANRCGTPVRFVLSREAAMPGRGGTTEAAPDVAAEPASPPLPQVRPVPVRKAPELAQPSAAAAPSGTRGL